MFKCMLIHTVQYVPLLEGAVVRDPMTDDFIDRGAAGLGKVVVVQRWGIAVPRCTCLKSTNMDKSFAISINIHTDCPAQMTTTVELKTKTKKNPSVHMVKKKIFNQLSKLYFFSPPELKLVNNIPAWNMTFTAVAINQKPTRRPWQTSKENPKMS